MIDTDNTARERRVEDRTIAYVHHAKRLVLELFGQEAAHNQPEIVMQLVNAMVQLETTEINAMAQTRLADAILKSKET